MAKLRRFFIDKIEPRNYKLEDKELTHRLTKVLRLVRGDSIILFDGSGSDFLFEILRFEKNVVWLKFINKTKGLPLPKKIFIYLSWLPQNKFQKILEFLAQLGIFQIHPLISQRSKNQKLKNYKHYKKIITQAAEIAGWSVITSIMPAIEFKDLELLKPDQTVVLDKRGQDFKELGTYLKEQDKINLIIGPEGGFNENEFNFLKSKKFRFLSLGSVNYKSETAAIFASALIMLGG